MDTTIIQVPVSKTLRERALATAISSGFSSIQEVIRVFLSQFATKEIGITFAPKAIKLSAKNDRRYAKMIEEIKFGKVKPFVARSVNELMDHLHGKDR